MFRVMSDGSHLFRQRHRPIVEDARKIGVARIQRFLPDRNSSSIKGVRIGVLALDGEWTESQSSASVRAE